MDETSTGAAGRRGIAHFARDQRGSITLQMIIFSILLFAMTGIVLDSGRLYSAHTQMQAYADRMALAAANELDGQTDAIDRAADAVFDGAGSGPYLGSRGYGENPFDVQEVVFYAQMGTPNGRANDLTDSAAFIVARATETGVTFTNGVEADSAAAQFAAVVVREAEIRSITKSIGGILVSLGTSVSRSTGDEQTIDTDPLAAENRDEPNIGFQTVAVATLERQTCADLSTIVFCNPWEEVRPGGPDGAPLGSDALDRTSTDWQNIPGRSLMVFAPNYRNTAAFSTSDAVPVNDGTEHGSLYDWDVTNQVMQLTDPISDPGAVCSLSYLLDIAGNPVASEVAVDYERYRNLCLMARARAETVCFEDTIQFSPAIGPDLTRATNTMFDRWAEPFKTAITNDITIPQTGLSRSQFFEPDSLATTAHESADRHGTDCPADDPNSEQDGLDDYATLTNSSCGEYDNFETGYETTPMPGYTFIRKMYSTGYGRDRCHDWTRRVRLGQTGPACDEDYIGDFYAGTGGTDRLIQRTLIEAYWNNMYSTDGTAPTSLALPGDIETWYQLYLFEKANMDVVTPLDAISRINRYSPEEASALGIADADRSNKFVKHFPQAFYAASGQSSVTSASYERRRIRSAMVNCKAAADALDTGAGTALEAPIAAIVDVYLPRAAELFCGSTGNPANSDLAGCTYDTSIESRMYAEMIDVVDDALLQRFTVQLVR